MVPNTHSFFGAFSTGEHRRLYFSSMESARDMLEDAEGKSISDAGKVASPEAKHTSNTSKLRKELKQIHGSWLRTLTFTRGVAARRAIRREGYKRFAEADKRGTFQRYVDYVWHWGRDRLVLAEAENQSLRDVQGLLQREQGELVAKQERFARAAKYFKLRRGPISHRELTGVQNMSKFLGAQAGKLRWFNPKDRGQLNGLRRNEEFKQFMFSSLLEEGVSAAELDTLMKNPSSLRSKIKQVYSKDGPKRRAFLRSVKYVNPSKHSLLGAIQSDLVNTEPTEVFKALEKNAALGQEIELRLDIGTAGATNIGATAINKSGQNMLLLDKSKSGSDPNKFMVLNLEQGMLVRKVNGRMIEYPLKGSMRRNTIKLPTSTLRSLSASKNTQNFTQAA